MHLNITQKNFYEEKNPKIVKSIRFAKISFILLLKKRNLL